MPRNVGNTEIIMSNVNCASLAMCESIEELIQKLLSARTGICETAEIETLLGLIEI